jgi:SAM-dependent methyltransferase
MRPTILPTGYWKGDTAHTRHDWAPPLAQWIAEYLQGQEATPVYDLGCGMGSYINHLAQAGFDVLGFEGDPPDHAHSPKIVKADLTEPLAVAVPGNVICLEVAEHVPEQFQVQFLSNVASACKTHLITSWAIRGQGGDGHVSCRDNDEAINLICAHGFKYLETPTLSARQSVVTSPLAYFRNTLLIFQKDASSIVVPGVIGD